MDVKPAEFNADFESVAKNAKNLQKKLQARKGRIIKICPLLC